MSKLQLDSRIGCRTCRSDLQLDRSARLDGLDPEACLRDNPEIKLRDGLAANVRFRYADDLFLAITRTRSRDVLRHQTWIALTRGGPERLWITWVSSTISMFFVRQSWGACANISCIRCSSTRNSPAATVPPRPIPATTTAYWSVSEGMNRATMA